MSAFVVKKRQSVSERVPLVLCHFFYDGVARSRYTKGDLGGRCNGDAEQRAIPRNVYNINGKRSLLFFPRHSSFLLGCFIVEHCHCYRCPSDTVLSVLSKPFLVLMSHKQEPSSEHVYRKQFFTPDCPIEKLFIDMFDKRDAGVNRSRARRADIYNSQNKTSRTSGLAFLRLINSLALSANCFPTMTMAS
ncbi:hypothetical protein HN011_009091 [Eciton burchellii]|nr:hypothetical protein HN011_009091 [Eciton burchellii]